VCRGKTQRSGVKKLKKANAIGVGKCNQGKKIEERLIRKIPGKIITFS
jgi:hypothetical protein